jgi:hypothetical protein
VADGLHEVGLAHADAAIEEERVVGLGRAFRNGLASGVGKLVAAANDESVEGVTRVELGGAIPIETCLAAAAAPMETEALEVIMGLRPPSWRSGVAAGSSSGVTNLSVGVIHAEVVDGLLDQVRVFIPDVPELNGGNTHE